MIINAYLNIKAFIPMHVIIYFSIYLSFYKKFMIVRTQGGEEHEEERKTGNRG